MKQVTLVGAGLTGSLLAIYLSRAGHQVDLFEARGDLRSETVTAGRSINLAISARGILPLQQLGIDQQILRRAVPVTGREMHNLDGTMRYQPYGRNEGEHNYALSRAQLNKDLLDLVDQEPGVTVHFNQRFSDYDLTTNTLTFVDRLSGQAVTYQSDHVFACDGAGSKVRAQLIAAGQADFSHEPLAHGYKELFIPRRLAGSLSFNRLHIWPRGSFMLMALPNDEGSFTLTLFMPMTGEVSFDALNNPAMLKAFFETYFADALPLIPDLSTAFFDNPTGYLGTVRGGPWQVADKCLLVGDAAHPIVPFLGQGMNCAFEDCRLLAQALAANDDWQQVFAEYYASRRLDADAIADMALQNYVEMRDRVADQTFLKQKALEQRLMKDFPQEYVSQYAMVSYEHTPYHTAFKKGQLQQRLLTAWLTQVDSVTAVPDQQLKAFVADYVQAAADIE